MGLVDRRPVVCRNLAMGFWVPLHSYTTRRADVELLQVQIQVLTSTDVPFHVSSGDLIPESTITSAKPWGLAPGLVRGVGGVPVSAVEHGGGGSPP